MSASPQPIVAGFSVTSQTLMSALSALALDTSDMASAVSPPFIC